MEKALVDEVEPDSLGGGVERHRLSELLGTTDVAINRYRIPPGEGFPGGIHAHVDQEEVFLVLSGEATFETLPPRDDGSRPGGQPDGAGGEVAGEYGEVTVGAGEVIRFAPGEFQSGKNDGEDDLVAIAIGAPRDTEDVRIRVGCPACGRGDVRLEVAEGVSFVCPDCGEERVPRDCPECGHGEMRVTLGDDGGAVVACRGCGAEFENAPLRDPT